MYGASGSGKTELLRTTVLAASVGDAFGAMGSRRTSMASTTPAAA